MKKECKGAKISRNHKIAKIIKLAIKHNQRVWYSKIYNIWITQKYIPRTNFYLMFDFRKI